MSENKTCTECSVPVRITRLGLCPNCYAKQRNKFGYSSTYVNAAPVREHILELLSSGMNMHRIALSARVGVSTIQYILANPKGPDQRVAGKTARAVLSINKKEAPAMSRLSDAVNQLREAAVIAHESLNGDSNDGHHEALVDLIDAAQGVIDTWSTK